MVILENMDGSIARPIELCLFTGFVWSAQVKWMSVAVGKGEGSCNG